MYGASQCSPMLKLMAVCIIMISTTTVDAISLRDYCDQQIYQTATFEHVLPSPYALPYYKRCLNHREWIKCLVETRKTKPNDVTVMPYEDQFPMESDIHDYGLLFCLIHLQELPRKEECSYNQNSCNREFEGKDPCSDSVERVMCLWAELKKCNIPEACPIKAYEYSLLGRQCLDQASIGNLTITDEVAKECTFGRGARGKPNDEKSNGQNVRAQPFIPHGTFILVFLLTYYAIHYYYI